MAFAAAVMSTSAGHKAFIRSPSNDEILDSYSPATPPRHEQNNRPSIPRSSSNNSNLSTRTPIMNSPDLSYINQFNTSLSSFNPRSPPGIHSSNAPNGMPESPHMIRCSTCNSQVPLLELSDHICRPSAPSSSTSSGPLYNPRQASLPSQHARLASGFNQDAASGASSNFRPPQPASRNLLNPLKVNVSQAWRQNGQQLEAPLPTPNRTPLPHSPSSASQSPSYHSPGTSPAAISNLSPSYPFDQQHRRYPTSELERNQQPSPSIGHSPGSDTVDLSAENNAGIGARMPFYERLQQQRVFVAPPSSPAPAISPSLLPAGIQKQYTPPPLSARSNNNTPWNRINEGEIPKSAISPGWSGLANEEPEIFARFDDPRRSEESNYIEAGDEEEEADEQQQQQHETSSSTNIKKGVNQPAHSHSQHHHIRETSDSGQSSAALSNSYSDHLDYLLNEGSTPDTSPEFPDTPLFKDNDLSASTSLSSSNGHFGLEQEQRRLRVDQREEAEEEEYHGYDDDIIDSYPTPQPGFSGRFGGLVIDDSASDAYHRSQAPLNHQGDEDRGRHGRLAPSPESVPLSSPLLRAHSDRAVHQESTPPFNRPLGRGIPASHSTPNDLARLAGINTSVTKQSSKTSPRKVDGSAIPFNGRRRLHSDDMSKDQFPLALGNSDNSRQLESTSPTATTPTGEASGLRLDACLDDLLKEMNRESIDTLPAASMAASSLRSPLPHGSDHSLTPTSPNGTSSRTLFDLKQQESLAVMEKDVPCDSCNQSIKIGNPVERDGQSFCNECYAQLYLPKCRKCRLPIEDKAIGSGDGKVKGKFHIGCFSCFSCSAPFPTGDFYVFGNRPYCAQHYHERNGTLCANAACLEEQRGIEGPCVSLVGEESGNGGRYHPTCFKCSKGTCDVLLDQYHYVLSGLPYCETHAREIEDQDNVPLTSRSASPPREFTDSNDFYDARYGASSNTGTGPEQRRRSASLDIPVQSLNALRKNAQAPNYRGMLARRKSSGRGRPSEASNSNGWDINGRNQLPASHPARIANGGYNGGPPPVSRTRRAEKRRTVISQFIRM